MGPQPSVSDRSLISTDSARDAIARAIDLQLGEGRRYSFAEGELGTGIKRTTLYSYVRTNDRHVPPGDVLLQLCHFLGASFTAKLLGPIGQGAHSLSAVSGTPAEIIAALSDGTAQFAIRGVDGVYCNIDQGQLEAVADRMIEILTPFSSKRGC